MEAFARRTAYYFAFGSAAAILFSIAISQVLLALSLAALLLSGQTLRFPPVRLPLALFFLITVAAVLCSGDPQSATPQIRKFFLFATLLVICSTFQTVGQVRALIVAWAGIGSLSALAGMAQFVARQRESVELHADGYGYLLDGRITGFAGHWMTFGAEEMIVLLMLASFLLFANRRWAGLLGWPLLAIMSAAVTLGMTRAIFLLGAPAGLSYLLWVRRRILLVGAALLAAGGIAVAPHAIRERVVSTLKPHGELDSNAHRAVCRQAGWQMIKAHPWLGLGPEQIGRQFDRYVPATVSRPLPHGWYGHLHNIYLQYAAERGIFGLGALMWFIAKVILDLARPLRSAHLSRAARAVLNGAVAVIIAILAEGLFEYNLGDSEVLTMFLSVVACGYVAVWDFRSGDVARPQSRFVPPEVSEFCYSANELPHNNV